MIGTAAIPVHLAVHLIGLAVAVALAAHATARRATIGPGWGALAVGAAMIAASHILAGALLTTGLAWTAYLRIAGYAGIAVGAAGGLRPGAAVIAAPLVIPVASPRAQLLAGVAGLAAAVAALRGVLGAGGALLAGGLVFWAAGDVLGGTTTWGTSAASIAGSALVGGWLLTRSRTSLLGQIAAAFVGALLLLVLGLAGLSGVVFGADLQRDELAGLEAAVDSRIGEIEQEWTEAMLTVSRLFAQQTLAGAIIEGDPQRLQRLAQQIAELPDTDIVVLLDGDGRIAASFEWTVEPRGELSRSDALAISGDDVVAAAADGAGSRGMIVLGDRDVVVVGASPVYPFEDGVERRDRLAGTIIAGRRVADPVFVGRVASTSDADVTLVIGGSVAATTLPEAEAEDVVALTTDVRVSEMVSLDGRASFLAADRLTTAGDAWFVLSRDAVAFAGAVERFTRTLFSIAVAGLLVAFAIAAWAAGRLTRPVRQLTVTAERVSAGDLDVRTRIDRPDEVGRLAVSFDHMTESLSAREEELRRAAMTEASLRERLEVLTESMEEALVAVGADGRVQTLNPAAVALLGVDRDRALGAPVGDLLAGIDEAGGDLLDALGQPESTQVCAVRGVLIREGQHVPVAATAAPLRSEEDPGRVYVLRDVTGERQVERMKTEFLSNISHELRTPLTPIKGYAEVLRRREVPQERVVEFADQIAIATGRLERIIGMLMDFAALEAGRVDIRLRPTALDEVVDDVLETWRTREPDRRFTRRLQRGLPEVHVDPSLLGRMLEELIDNAVKFSAGPVRLRASADGDVPDGRVRLTVSDEGEGIAVEEVEAITQDFRQIDGSSTRQYGGLGLGLTLVSRIAQRFDAEIVVRSENGDGTEVDLLLPVSEGSVS